MTLFFRYVKSREWYCWCNLWQDSHIPLPICIGHMHSDASKFSVFPAWRGRSLSQPVLPQQGSKSCVCSCPLRKERPTPKTAQPFRETAKQPDPNSRLLACIEELSDRYKSPSILQASHANLKVLGRPFMMYSCTSRRSMCSTRSSQRVFQLFFCFCLIKNSAGTKCHSSAGGGIGSKIKNSARSESW